MALSSAISFSSVLVATGALLAVSVLAQNLPTMGEFQCKECSTVCPPVNCPYGVVMDKVETPCSCCKTCITYREENATCYKTFPTEECGPGLGCKKVEDGLFLCKPLETNCTKEQVGYDERYREGKVGMFEVRPECDAYGKYEAKKCLPSSTCFCVDENNKRIFGEVAPGDTNQTKTMDCRCSREYEKMKQLGYEPQGFAHCMPNGNFDRLQCYGQACQCLTEKLKPVGDIFPITAIQEAPCYDPEIHSPKYLRPCEEELSKLQGQLDYYARKNITIIGFELPQCTPDGFYHPVQTREDKRICVTHSGDQIEDFVVAVDSPSAKQMTCACARTRSLLSNQNTVKPQCCKNGNFESKQCRNGYCYCVNGSGEQIGEEKPVADASTLQCNVTCPA